MKTHCKNTDNSDCHIHCLSQALTSSVSDSEVQVQRLTDEVNDLERRAQRQRRERQQQQQSAAALAAALAAEKGENDKPHRILAIKKKSAASGHSRKANYPQCIMGKSRHPKPA